MFAEYRSGTTASGADTIGGGILIGFKLSIKRCAFITAAALSVITLAGCSVGPNFRKLEPPRTERFTPAPLPAETVSAPGTAGSAQRFVSGADIPGDWWTLFHSAPLDELVRAAIKDSPTLASAQSALRTAQENLNSQRGSQLFPAVDANLAAERIKVSSAGTTGPYNLYNASVNVSYKLDLFGGSRRQLEGLGALVDYQSFQLQGAYLALTSNIVTTAVQQASLRGQIRATQETIAAQQKQLDVVNRQFKLGGVSKAEVLAQQTQVAITQSSLPPLERQLAAARHRLAVLSGKLPSEAELPEFDIESLTLPLDLPVSLPSSVVRQRPDIRASEALLHQASALVGVATANLYPQITLSGNVGSSATKVSDLFSGPAMTWTIGAGLLQPLFRGGALNAARRAAIAAYDQANAQYRETVLESFQQVADTLRALDTDATALKAQTDADTAARQSLELTNLQYKGGSVSYLNLLIAQRQYQQAHVSLVQAMAQRYADTAALFQALGGGWWNRPPPEEAAREAPPAISQK